MSLRDFLHMGGYAAYVWPSYLFTIAAIGWMVIAARRAHRRALEIARKRVVMEKSPS
ncbi:MAG TPA: heme exporter protein CcmD [Steroidobacteraceae bacterium]|nr:heme exporter protein CcmD [Steroidobacteraceae bacterium]